MTPEEFENRCFESRTNRPKILLQYADTIAAAADLNRKTKLLCAIMYGMLGIALAMVAETYSYRATMQNKQLSGHECMLEVL